MRVIRYEVPVTGGWTYHETEDEARTRAMQPDGRGCFHRRYENGTLSPAASAERRLYARELEAA